jgi:high affinity Mn2+ porin
MTASFTVLLGLAALSLPVIARGEAAADEWTPLASQGVSRQTFAVHGQFTYIEQEDSGFRAPYRGSNSLTPRRGKETADATFYIGLALWRGAEIWMTPEIDQGFGLDNTLGVAGFPSGEAYKVGKNQPYLRLPRLFVRDTINGQGRREPIEAAASWLAGDQSVNRWVITLGKFAVTDIFDSNQYAHDPRADFLNWAAVDAGAFDYAADAWGFTLGAAAEWYRGPWTLRAGAFDLSNVPNSPHLEPGFHEFQILLEAEHRHEMAGRSGKVMVTMFESRGRMGLLLAAVQLAERNGAPVDIAQVRAYRSRLGVDLNLEQQLAWDLGLFLRVSKAAGNVEAYEFTDIDRSVSAGLSMKGSAWSRDRDRAGVAAINNGISAARRQYLNAGGLGILIGDGKLPHPAAEQIIETYYSAALLRRADFSLDYQWVRNPGYNRDRGPVSVFAVRIHAQF